MACSIAASRTSRHVGVINPIPCSRRNGCQIHDPVGARKRRGLHPREPAFCSRHTATGGLPAWADWGRWFPRRDECQHKWRTMAGRCVHWWRWRHGRRASWAWSWRHPARGEEPLRVESRVRLAEMHGERAGHEVHRGNPVLSYALRHTGSRRLHRVGDQFEILAGHWTPPPRKKLWNTGRPDSSLTGSIVSGSSRKPVASQKPSLVRVGSESRHESPRY